MGSPAPLTPEVLGTPDGIGDPYPAYRAFRDASPVRYVRIPAAQTPQKEPVYSWALLRYADVHAAVRDLANFSSHTPSVIKVMPKLALLHDDPPYHTHMRRLVSKAFSPQRIATLADWVRRIANELLDAAGKGTVEVMSAYAVPLPIRVIGGMLGIPDSDSLTFRQWSDAVVSYAVMPPEVRAAKTQEMMAYWNTAITTRREKPVGDLISGLIEAEVEGTKLSDAEIRGFAAVLLIAGNETTTNLLGNMLGILADRPELYQRARADRSLVEPIIEESLRFESPVQRFPRVTARPVRVAGVEIGAGELVDMFYGAANRDPAVFEDPDTFRVDRTNLQEHIAFGHGTHFCLGAPLARLEARITLNAFLDRFPTLSRGAQPAERQRVAQVSLGYKSLPLLCD